MRELKVLGNGHLKLNRGECKEFFTEELEEMVRSQLKRLIEEALLVERDRHLNRRHYEHAPVSRFDFRNGFYFRDLVTKLGVLCRPRVPRTRKGFRSQFLPRYQRRQQAVNNLILQAFLRGIFTRQVGPVLEPVLGEACSAQTISRITRRLNRRGAVPSPPVARRLRLSLPRRRGPQGSRPGGQSSPPHGVGGLRRASQRQTRNPRLPVGAGRKRNRLAGIPAGSFSSWAGRPELTTPGHRWRHGPARCAAGGLSAHPAAAVLGT